MACVGGGSNLGDRDGHLDAADRALRASPAIRHVRRGPTLETDPVGPPGQGPYRNTAWRLETVLAPRALLDLLLGIERTRGRDRARGVRWGPRTLDLDLLVHGEAAGRWPGLILPHPHLHERTFVLGPLAPVAGDLVPPGLGRSVRELAADLGVG